jgi:hypothetical protein
MEAKMRNSRWLGVPTAAACVLGAIVIAALQANGVWARVPDPSPDPVSSAQPAPGAPAQPAQVPAGSSAGSQASGPAGGPVPNGSDVPMTGSVSLVDKTWICTGPVNLDSVTVTITGVSKDAVYLRSGCTGRIGSINIVQYHGDGIHVNAGAHDLVVGGGTIRCYAHDVGKHQDGIQVMGGTNVAFDNLDVGCYSANNSQVWINSGANGNGMPTNVVFKGGHFQGYFAHGQYGPGGSYGIAIVNSVSSGAIGATICPNAHPQRALYIGSGAVNPINVGNNLPASCP